MYFFFENAGYLSMLNWRKKAQCMLQRIPYLLLGLGHHNSLPYLSYNLKSLFHYLLMCMQKCVMRWKQCRPWSDAAFCGVCSGSTLFVQACRFQYLGLLWYVIIKTENHIKKSKLCWGSLLFCFYQKLLFILIHTIMAGYYGIMFVVRVSLRQSVLCLSAMITPVNDNEFSPNLVCALILRRSLVWDCYGQIS